VLPDISDYRAADISKSLDEAHLKAGMKALAKLHAVSYAFFNSISSVEQSGALNQLKDPLVGAGVDPAAREKAKNGLIGQLEGIVGGLKRGEGGQGLLQWTQGLKGSIYNIYKNARQPNSIFSVLCHGCPTPRNIVFAYKDGLPVDAKLVNFSSGSYSCAVSDLQVFINTGGDITAREDFLLRFVYYETLVTVLKSFGVKDILSFDDLKKEYVKQRLYGYLESSFLLSSYSGSSVSPLAGVSSGKISSSREVNSKILGKFSPMVKVSAVAAFSSGPAVKEDEFSFNEKIVDMMSRASNVK